MAELSATNFNIGASSPVEVVRVCLGPPDNVD